MLPRECMHRPSDAENSNDSNLHLFVKIFRYIFRFIINLNIIKFRCPSELVYNRKQLNASITRKIQFWKKNHDSYTTPTHRKVFVLTFEKNHKIWSRAINSQLRHFWDVIDSSNVANRIRMEYKQNFIIFRKSTFYSIVRCCNMVLILRSFNIHKGNNVHTITKQDNLSTWKF